MYRLLYAFRILGAVALLGFVALIILAIFGVDTGLLGRRN
jgi:hypothetical protein